MLLLAVPAGACNDRARGEACEAAWAAPIREVDAASAALDAIAADGGVREREAAAAAANARSRMRALTIRREDALGYPQKVRPLVRRGRMLFTAMTPLRPEEEGGLVRIPYDLEMQGDARALANTLRALYDQPVALTIERLEVNITDERLHRAAVKARVRVWSWREVPAPAETPEPAASFRAAIAEVAPPAACAGRASAGAAAWKERRETLLGRTEEARRLGQLERREAAAAEMLRMAGDLVRRRDDDRAAWSAHADALVARARAEVTGMAELRFRTNGEPEWR